MAKQMAVAGGVSRAIGEYFRAHEAVELKKLARLLPPTAQAAQRLQTFVKLVQGDHKLEACTFDSTMQSLYDCAMLDLWPGPLGHMYLIPYGQEMKPIPGYKGLISLMKRPGTIGSVDALVVHEHDDFVYVAGTAPRIEHTPTLRGDAGEPYAAYAVAHYRQGRPQSVVLRKDTIEAIRDRAPSAKTKDSPWNGAPHEVMEMWKKTAIRRLWKLVGEDDPQVAKALNLMDRADGYVIDVTPEPAAPAQATEDALDSLFRGAQRYSDAEPPHDPETGEVGP